MKTIIAIVIALAACGDNVSLDKAREIIKKECGEAPLAPGWSVSFETVNGFDRALMTREDFIRISQWREDVEAYAACTQGYATEPRGYFVANN